MVGRTGAGSGSVVWAPRSLGQWQGLQVPQKLLAVGRGAVLLDDSLRLSHQELRKQNAACFENLCKQEHTLNTPGINSKPLLLMGISFTAQLKQPGTEHTATRGKLSRTEWPCVTQ